MDRLFGSIKNTLVRSQAAEARTTTASRFLQSFAHVRLAEPPGINAAHEGKAEGDAGKGGAEGVTFGDFAVALLLERFKLHQPSIWRPLSKIQARKASPNLSPAGCNTSRSLLVHAGGVNTY
jgi:hypothetical protein